MTDLTEAARATRKYEVTMTKNDQSGDVFWNAVRGSTHIYQFNCRDDAQAACDRLNLLAVMNAVLAMDRPVSREFKRDLEALIEDISTCR